ncbi:hypothetical protein ALQ76_102122 [Pseudomonas syringae pv. atrofaciens]|nr:hypothetical protein ALQ76_102122 [Pseudomonas syringae pv. atrofaciens]
MRFPCCFHRHITAELARDSDSRSHVPRALADRHSHELSENVPLLREQVRSYGLLRPSARVKNRLAYSEDRCLQNIRVIRFDTVQAQVVEEVGEAHPG